MRKCLVVPCETASRAVVLLNLRVMEFQSVFPVILVNSQSLDPQLKLCFLKSLDISWSRTFSLGFKNRKTPFIL